MRYLGYLYTPDRTGLKLSFEAPDLRTATIHVTHFALFDDDVYVITDQANVVLARGIVDKALEDFG